MECRPRDEESAPCWRYRRGKSIPAWVAVKCHYLGDGKLTVNGIDGLRVAEEGDWIVDLGIGVMHVKSDEFERDYLVRESEHDEWINPNLS